MLRVTIIGPSMEPTLGNGQVWLALRGRWHIRVNDMIVFCHPERPELLEVKRLVSKGREGWWVEGDNHEFSTDSRSFGAIAPEMVRAKIWRRIS